MAVSRRCVVVACAVLVVLPLAACSKDSKRPAAVAVSSSSSSSSSSSLPPLPATASTTPASSDPCAASPPPASAVNVTHADGDFNGDGQPDVLTVYGTGTTTQPSPYHVQIELAASQGTTDTVIADAATDNNQVVKALAEPTSRPARDCRLTGRGPRRSWKSGRERPPASLACSSSSGARSRA